MDVLSQVLKSISLEGAVFFNAETSAPWCAQEPKSCVFARAMGRENSHVIIYHLVIEGRAFAQTLGGSRVALEAGDIIMFPHGDAHLLGNGKPVPPVDVTPDIERILSGGLALTRNGGGGETTRFICGYLLCDPQLSSMVLAGLPALVKVNIREDPSGLWIENCLRHTVDHISSSGAGTEAVLAKLSETLFAESLRRYIAALSVNEKGWLAGARDPDVGKALGILHKDPSRRWTIAALAEEVALSRAVLAERFSHYLGEGPMAYLTRWRMRLGARLLTTSSESVAQVGVRVGYDSEAAFNRAFKKEMGAPPAQYRKQHRAQDAREQTRRAMEASST